MMFREKPVDLSRDAIVARIRAAFDEIAVEIADECAEAAKYIAELEAHITSLEGKPGADTETERAVSSTEKREK